MSQTFADFEFHAQDRNATQGTNASKEGHATDSHRQRLEMTMKVVRQSAWRQVFPDLCSCLKVQLWMNMLVKTNLHHGCQFPTDLRSRMQGNCEDTFLQP